MLHFFVTRRGAHTFDTYLNDWLANWNDCFFIHIYEDYQWPVASSGTFIFTDLERLSPGQLELAVEYAERLKLSGVDLRILNSPEKVLRRFELLNEMSRSESNRFRAFRLREMPDDFRFPGFLRMERDHNGAATSLLENRDQLNEASKRLLDTGADVDDVLAVEFCDTISSDGFYRKYSFFIIADSIIPAHIIFSRDWVAKDGALNAEQVVEEDRFHAERPYASWAAEVFKAAGIDYGRIDFSLCRDGMPQVWEINTNPMLLGMHSRYQKFTPLELPRKELLAARFIESWKRFLPAETKLAVTGRSSRALKTFFRRCRKRFSKRGKTSP
jgi:hypothetical protein